MPSDVTLWQWLFEGPSPAAGCSRRDAVSEKTPPRAFINVQTKTRLTHAQIRDAAAALSTSLLRRHGLQPGDVVSLVSPNAVTYPLVTHGVMRAGGVPAFSAPAYNEAEMRHAFRTVGTRFVFCHPETLAVVRAAARQEGVGEERIFVFSDEEETVDGFVSLSALVDEGARLEPVEAARLPVGKTNAEVPAFLCFSSGTTGLPKAVRFCHGWA